MIIPLSGDDLGVYKKEQYLLNEWRGKGRVVFSCTQRGNAVEVHWAADKSAKREIKKAIIEYMDWVFTNCKWCTMMITVIDKPSVMRIAKSVGGIDIATDEHGSHIFMRLR